jgi:endonuclease/exonuclease/phosphatase family metal-dependent hydrolase
MHGTDQPWRRILSAAVPILCCGMVTLGSATVTPAPSGSLTWIRAVARDEVDASARWMAAVGTPLVLTGPVRPASYEPCKTVIVSWNTHVGGGDVERLVADLRDGRLTGDRPDEIVLLLQEVYRAGDDVPRDVPPGARVAWREAPLRPDGTREDIVATAERLGMSLFYAPSMRNGSDREDRGNAILATVPLLDPFAIELPLESQRRVAIGALVAMPGRPPFRVMSVHFTNMVAHHLWLLAEAARVRQAEALRRELPDGALALGGDFNSWFSYHDAAYRELAKALPGPRPQDQRATFGPMRLDHLLFRIGNIQPEVRRLDDKYGSDHYPLIAELR